MKPYVSDAPEFSEVLDILETTDLDHADNFNKIYKELFENTLVLMIAFEAFCNEVNIENSFLLVFTHVDISGPMTTEEIEMALATVWNGETSEDERAMSKEEVEAALTTEWNGETSEDETAISAEEISSVLS